MTSRLAPIRVRVRPRGGSQHLLLDKTFSSSHSSEYISDQVLKAIHDAKLEHSAVEYRINSGPWEP